MHLKMEGAGNLDKKKKKINLDIYYQIKKLLVLN